MDYSIYTYGGGEILHGVFNGIALLFASNNPYFTSVGSFAALIGIIGVGIRALPRASFPLVFKDWFIPTIVCSTLLFGPKTSVHVIDEIDTNHQYGKINHIPVGIAAIGSIFSTISKHATETVETAFFTSDANRMSRVGPMFAAQLVHQARLVTIKDPITRENLKDFVRQCYAWPYVFGNISPGKKAALESGNILEFIAQNPHPGLGIYWREANGTTSFKNCSQCLPSVREALSLETANTLVELASSLFSTRTSGDMSERSSLRLQSYFGEAWQTIAKSSSSAAEVIQQELMINSYREMLADKRDELGLGRFDSNLIHLNTLRGQSSQNASFLSVSSLVGQNLPHMHASFFAIALILFALIAPWTFALGGFHLIKIWLKVMASIALWPVLYAVLSCIGTLWAAKAGATAILGTGTLNLLTQNGLGDAAYNTYCWVMSLQAITPFLAWAIISRGEQAFSQMTSSFTQSSEAFASRAGAEMVDGNVSFDTQSIGNHSMANVQIAQQQLGASMNTGMRIDDGQLSLTYGPNGAVVAQQHQSSLATNLTRNDTASQMYSLASQEAQGAAFQEGMQAQNAVTIGSNEMYAFAKNAAHSTSLNDSFGTSEAANAQKYAQDTLSLAEKLGKQHGVDTKVAFDAAVRGSMGFGTGFNIGVDGAAGLSAASADTNLVQKIQDSDLGKQFNESLQKLVNYSDEHKASLSDSFATSHLDQAQESFAKAKTHTMSMGWHMNHSESLQKQAQQARNTSTSASTNATDELIGQAAQQYGCDMGLGAQSLVRGGHAEAMAGNTIDSLAPNKPVLTKEETELRTSYNAGVETLGTMPNHNAELESKRANLTGLEHQLANETVGLRQTMSSEVNRIESTIANQEAHLTQERAMREDEYHQETDKTLVERTFTKAGNNLGSLAEKAATMLPGGNK